MSNEAKFSMIALVFSGVWDLPANLRQPPFVTTPRIIRIEYTFLIACIIILGLRGYRHISARVRRRLLRIYNSVTVATTRTQFAALQSHYGVQ